MGKGIFNLGLGSHLSLYQSMHSLSLFYYWHHSFNVMHYHKLGKIPDSFTIVKLCERSQKVLQY